MRYRSYYAAVFQATINLFGILLACLTFKTSILFAAEGEVATLAHLKLQLVSEVSEYQHGKNFWIGIRAEPEKDWHIYWKYPGDSGTSLKADWSSSFGANVRGPEFPIPKRIPVGPLVNFGYDSETLFLFEAEPQTNSAANIKLRVDSEWLVCQEECIPVNAILTLEIPAHSSSQIQSSGVQDWSEKFELTRKILPFDYPSVALKAYSNTNKVILEGNLPSDKQKSELTFFPLASLTINNAAAQTLSNSAGKFALELSSHKDSKAKELHGILVSSNGWSAETRSPQAINVKIPIEELKAPPISKKNGHPQGLILTIFLAFIGGLILNLMPCVFPILTLKIFSLVTKKQLEDRGLHLHSIFFTLGVVFAFISMALFIVAARASGEAIGWGFQLQSPGFVSCLALLTLIVGLNFLGVFEIGASLQRITGKLDAQHRHKNQNLKFFLDGILMTTLSTPCTAPFMGSALAYGLSAPTLQLLAVFTALAFGMAAPFVLLSYSARLRALLPKPGAWMETFKKFLAFPLLATTIWLLWVLGLQSGVNVLSAELAILLCVAFILWIYGEFAGPNSHRGRRQFLSLLTFLVLGIAFIKSASIASNNKPSIEINWEPFSQGRVDELRKQNRIVYVDFTAAWCITCQVNKLVAFSSSDVISKLKNLNVATLEADWTNRDPKITQALSSFGREGVPLNIIYPLRDDHDPEILPQVLTPGIVIDALERAQH